MIPCVRVFLSPAGGPDEAPVFTSSFRIGRDPASDVHVPDRVVSRHHAEVVFIGGRWWLQDLNSANGTWVDGRRIERIPLEGRVALELGSGGPALTLEVEEPVAPADDDLSLTHYREHYLDGEGEAGQRTMMVRRAFAQVQRQQKRKYGLIITMVFCLFLAAGSVAVYKHLQVQRQRRLAADIFYAIKALDLEYAQYLEEARRSSDPVVRSRVTRYRQEKKKLEASYDTFLDTLKVYERSISPQDRIILRMARVFGECELFMPEDFSSEVHRYIDRWKSTDRFYRAVQRAEKQGYTEEIARTMLDYDLPPQFFYLALQESNFDVNACGPRTRWGIAKGMWQFIPDTARAYGLSTGPLVEYKRPDPRDERHDFVKSTRAAARYLRRIYDTDAQASGLLVMASYNWGENRVIRMIRAMPENPRERNFWQFLKRYRGRIPKQTYDYVFSIFSAAVIGEDPRLFGFDMDNPLASIGEQG